MKALVTGGAGFIGSHVADKLIAGGHEVVVIDDLSSGDMKNVNPQAVFIKRSITDNLEELFSKYKFDVVFHLAAQINVRRSLQDPVFDANVNIMGSLRLIDACTRHKVKKFIFSSSGGALYSPNAALPCTENSEIAPQSPYGVAKWTVENYLRIMKSTRGLDYVALRYSNVHGPRQNAQGEAGVISIFFNQALSGKNLTIFGDGEQTRDFVHVSDVVAANLRALELSGTYNVSTGIETSVNELAHAINALAGPVPIVHGAPIVGEIVRNVLSSEKLKSEGWRPEMSFNQGLAETIARAVHT
ncbi:MAG: NAD-dependent epimerase/dehydratase family protein [Nanoarchaeota archaeon]